MSRPLMVDLFCGAGGASMGYYHAGFNVIGVDKYPQRNYPFQFIWRDVLTLKPEWFRNAGVVAIAASPPCKTYTTLSGLADANHVGLVPETRTLLDATELPYVIENVPGAPLLDPLILCGSMFGLGVRRHRLFELGHWKTDDVPECDHATQESGPKPYLKKRYDKGFGARTYASSVIGVYGGGEGLGTGEVDMWRRAMGIDWMIRNELSQAIPPAYTEWIGVRLMETL